MLFTCPSSRRLLVCSCRSLSSPLSTAATAPSSFVPRDFVPYPYEYQQLLTLPVVALTSEGLGIAVDSRYPNRKVIVPKVCVGEVVTVKIYRNYENHKDFTSLPPSELHSTSEADLVRIEEKSPNRQTPPCKYFDQCSGCQLQHLSIKEQHSWKREKVLSLLRQHNCTLHAATLDEVVASPKEIGYRAKLTPQLSWKRGDSAHDKKVKSSDNEVSSTSSNRNIDIQIGFQKIDNKTILDITKCPIATDAINESLKSFRNGLISGCEEDDKSRARKVINKKSKGKFSQLFRDDMNESAGSVHLDPNEMITQHVNGFEFKYRAGEFFQVNPFALPHLISHVLDEAACGECTHLVDAYCGSGLFSICASSKFTSVIGIEVSTRAVQAAMINSRVNKLDNVDFICGNVQELFAEVKPKVCPNKASIIVDPSRKGCDVSFLSQLVDFAPRRIVYVSCNPISQARDAYFIISHGYEIKRVAPFDLFPQTKHVENVLTFEKTS